MTVRTISRLKYGAGGYRKRRFRVKQHGAGKRLQEVKRKTITGVKKWAPIVLPALAGFAVAALKHKHDDMQKQKRRDEFDTWTGRYSGDDHRGFGSRVVVGKGLLMKHQGRSKQLRRINHRLLNL